MLDLSKLLNRIFYGSPLRSQEEINATWKPDKKRSQTWPGCLAVSMAEKGGNGRRVYRKRVIGTVDQYSDAVEARRIATGILAMPGSGGLDARTAHNRSSK